MILSSKCIKENYPKDKTVSFNFTKKNRVDEEKDMNHKLEELEQLKKNRKRNRIYTGRSQITFDLEYFEHWYEKYINSTKKNFFSQKELAEKLGCSRTTAILIVHEYLNDREKFLKRIKKKE